MVMHLGAFAQSIDPAGVFAQVNAVQDQVVTTQGKFLFVPNGCSNLVGMAAVIDNTVANFAKFSSPSLRALTDMQVRPINTGLVFGVQGKTAMQFANPQPLVPNEGLEFDVLSNPAAAVQQYGLAWLADGAVKPANGPFFTTHATAAAALAADTWVNSNLTFDEALPSGSYQVVGLRVESTNGVAARLVFVGGAFRPGVPVMVSNVAQDFGLFRNGNAGVLGQFDNTTPPTVDVLGVTDIAQDVWLDLVKIK